MDEYLQKLEKLPTARLEGLVKNYHKTIQSLEDRIRDAKVVGMYQIVDYSQQEVDKKKIEVATIENILEKRLLQSS